MLKLHTLPVWGAPQAMVIVAKNPKCEDHWVGSCCFTSWLLPSHPVFAKKVCFVTSSFIVDPGKAAKEY